MTGALLAWVGVTLFVAFLCYLGLLSVFVSLVASYRKIDWAEGGRKGVSPLIAPDVEA